MIESPSEPDFVSSLEALASAGKRWGWTSRLRDGLRSRAAKGLGLLWLMIGFGLVSASDASAEVSAGLEAQLQEALQEDPFQVDDGQLYRAALLEDEELEPLLARLDDVIEDDEDAFEPLWLAASLHWRYGNLDRALALFEGAAAIRAEPLVLFRAAQLLDAGGKTAEAVEQYLKTFEAKPDEDLAERIQLRLALLKSTADQVEQIQVDLAAYAKGRDQAFQNRAGVVLALAGKPSEALALYQPAEDGNQRFKQLIRIAEWAMAADDMAQARESAWGALRSARLRQDRRYALTVLAESYRRDEKLDQLIERFAATPDLSAEARMTWIDLLREQGDADKALALFQEAKGEADGDELFTADMRRELLEICRDAGRHDLLVENFREMIATEPYRLEWRSGLCRFYLERGQRDKALAVWDDYREQAQRGDWLDAASATMELGLDQLAQAFAEDMIRGGQGKERLAALQFLFDLHKDRGREDDMRAVLTRMDALAAPDASERARLAESWEQLGRQDKAAEVLQKLRAARGPENVSAELETRLAWLYSETGAEQQAYEAWKSAWLRADSPGRRRYIEDRLMATASRLGKLADIVIELEEKLAEGKADKRDSALLVRLYTRVGDPVSAAEIIDDFMEQSGGTEIQTLEEQARVYVMCNDYYYYEKTLRRLMQLDPEGSPEYLTQLAMSALERGRNDEARAILTEMRGLKENPASAEFEAGVLKIAGMHREAAGAYWRGIAQHPDRIDAYLLLGQTLQTLGKGRQAIGVFQYLIENADEDDLFTIAVDGLLNMNNSSQGTRPAPGTLQWARRAILERLAGKDDKVYLFQLVRDLSEDLRDPDMMMRALAETLPIAGEQRTTQLRELMELARAAPMDREGMLRFGRRLVGIGEVIPPQVYLDLGSIFLEDGDIRYAVKTFDKTNDGLDHGQYRRKVAFTFEQKRYIKSALRVYEKLLITESSDVELLVKVGELNEQLGRDAEATAAHRRALELLVGRQLLFSLKVDDSTDTGSRIYPRGRNLDQFEKYYPRVMTGLLASADPEVKACQSLIDDSLEALKADLFLANKESATAGGMTSLTLGEVPRVAKRSESLRHLTLAYGHLERARVMEDLLLEAFPEDETLLPSISRTWDNWGYIQRARDLVKTVPANPGREEAEEVLGEGGGCGSRQVFQLVLKGDQVGARGRLRDIDQLLNRGWSLEESNSLFAAARCLEDSAAVERLARYAIDKAPRNQNMVRCIEVFTRALPTLDQNQRESFAAHVKNVIETQGGAGMNAVSFYFYPRLNELTGEGLKLPIRIVRPHVDSLLGGGGECIRRIPSLFNLLGQEEYRILLRETYRKARSSDRLTLVFSLICQQPGKMNTEMEATFIELAEEAAPGAPGGPLKTYQTSTRPGFYLEFNNTNAGFEARLLEKLAEREPFEIRMGLLLEQAKAWNRAGETQRGLEAAGKAFSLALKKEKTFATVLAVLPDLPPVYLDAFLTILDRAETDNGRSVDLDKKRIMVLRQARQPDRMMTVLRKSIKKFPNEPVFRRDLRKALEKEGRYYEAIETLEALVELEPDNWQHRRDLQAAWTRLAHPIKARDSIKRNDEPKRDTANRAKRLAGTRTAALLSVRTWPVSIKAAPRPSGPQISTAAQGVGKTEGETEESPLEPASTQLLKKYYEADQWDAARLSLRRLWYQYSALDKANRSRTFRMPSIRSGRYYEWPANTPSAVQETPPTAPEARLGGLKGFLALEPLAFPYEQPATVWNLTLFSAIGSERFAAEEMETWLRAIDPREYRGLLFEEMLKVLVKHRIAERGVEPLVNDAIGRYTDGDLSTLDQHVLLAALELHPEAGGEPASAFLHEQLDTLDPADLWKMLRIARCFVERGEQDVALSLYHWCGANVSYSRSSRFSQVDVTPLMLVEEIRRNLEGASRIRALETVLPLMTPIDANPESQSKFAHFVLSTWAHELAPPEVYPRCPEICRRVVRDDVSTQKRQPGSLELATLFLAAGGHTEKALNGLQLVLAPPTRAGISSPAHTRNRDYFLQQWLPDDMTTWPHADQWLSGIVERVRQWQAAKELSTAEAVKILSLVAVRQHHNNFKGSAQATLAAIRTLSLTNPNAAIWFSDAAEIMGNQALALEVETELLKQRRLPIVRVASLLQSVAEQQGVSTALQLAEEASQYTWEPGFLQTMTTICQDAGKDERARLWRDRYQQVVPPQPDIEP